MNSAIRTLAAARLLAARRLTHAASVFILGAAAFGADASTVYSYQGEKLTPDRFIPDHANIPGKYTTDMNLDISFELATPLAPNSPYTIVTPSVLSFSFLDGRFLRSALVGPSDTLRVEFSTDGAGKPREWLVIGHFWDGIANASDSTEHVYSTVLVFAGPFENFSDFARVSLGVAGQLGAGNEQAFGFSKGTWTVTTNPVPVPAAFYFLGSALAGLSLMRRRAA